MKRIPALTLVSTLVFSIPLAASAKKKEADPADKIGKYRVEGIDVVQGRVFQKRGRHEFSLGAGVIPNNTFKMYELLQAHYTYHFREGLAFEGHFMQALSQDKQIIDDLSRIPCPTGADALFDSNNNQLTGNQCGITLDPPPDAIQRIFGGNIVWSPIYGKFAVFSKKIIHFDIFLTAGAGMFDNEASNRFAFNVGGGWKFFVEDWWGLRFDFRNFTVREGAPFNNIVNNRLFSLMFSFFLPPHVKE